MNWDRPHHEIVDNIEYAWHRLWGWRPLYWLRCHTFTKYHIIDIRGQDNYKWGWIDRSHAMYLACFKLLEEFVEKECPDIGVNETEADYSGTPPYDGYDRDRPVILDQIKISNEIRTLYDWWKTGRKIEHDACSKMLDGVDLGFGKTWKKVPGRDLYEYNKPVDHRYDDWCVENDRLDAKDEEMFQRLVKVRGSLWT